LRDERGLVGNQLLTDDIPAGPVTVPMPEEFVDPLQSSAPLPTRGNPAPFHPGHVHDPGFVPPSLPGEPAPVVDAAGEPVIAGDTSEDEDQPDAVGDDGDDESGEEMTLEEAEAILADPEIAALAAEASAAAESASALAAAAGLGAGAGA
jgi:hypothetical protein